MANLIAITYPDPDTAGQAMERVDWAAFDKLVDVIDACWMTNENGKVVIQPQSHPVAAKAALGGGVGLVIGALFAVPLIGLAAGAALGGFTGKHSEQRFDDVFIESIKSNVADGGSAIVVLYEEGLDTVRAGGDLAQFGGTIHSTTIPLDELSRIQSELDQHASG